MRDLVDSCVPGDVVMINGEIKVASTEEGFGKGKKKVYSGVQCNAIFRGMRTLLTLFLPAPSPFRSFLPFALFYVHLLPIFVPSLLTLPLEADSLFFSFSCAFLDSFSFCFLIAVVFFCLPLFLPPFLPSFLPSFLLSSNLRHRCVIDAGPSDVSAVPFSQLCHRPAHQNQIAGRARPGATRRRRYKPTILPISS